MLWTSAAVAPAVPMWDRLILLWRGVGGHYSFTLSQRETRGLDPLQPLIVNE